MSTAVVRRNVFRVEHLKGIEIALITQWTEHYAGYGVHEYRYLDAINNIPKVDTGQAGTTQTLDFNITFMHKWLKFELKHVTSALIDSTAVLTYGLYHNVSTDLPYILMRGNAVGAANIVETFADEEFVYPPQNYRFTFSVAVNNDDYVEPRFTVMERF